jgi:hypothetical protein
LYSVWRGPCSPFPLIWWIFFGSWILPLHCRQILNQWISIVSWIWQSSP